MEQPSLQIGGGDWAVKETKLLGTNPVLNRKLPVEMDFTNFTIGSRVNKEGFIENGPKNLLTFSEDFSNVIWTKSAISVLSNQSVSPEGDVSADKLIPNLGTQISRILNNGASISAGVVTFSIFVKIIDFNFFFFREDIDNVLSNTIFDLTLKTTPTLASGRTGTITDYANGYLRIELSATSPDAIISNFGFGFCDNGTSIGVTGDGVKSSLVWGAQLEQGSVATEYYPTTTRLNIPRIDYSSGEAALLLEPQRTNIQTFSNDFTNSTYFKNFANVSLNNAISPEGIQNSPKLFLNGSQPSYYIATQNNYVSGSSYVFSIFAKKDELDVLTLFLNNINVFANTQSHTFNLTTGVATINGSNISGGMQDYGNGWYRCFLIASAISSALAQVRYIIKIGAENDNTKGMSLYGMQTEISTYPTSYIPTESSAATRNQDLISKTGISDLINSVEGTFFVEAKTFIEGGITRVISVSDGTFNNRISIAYHSTTNRIQIFSTKSGSTLFNFEILTATQTNFNKVAVVFNNSSAKFFMNGILIQQVTISSSYAAGTLNKLSADAGPANNLNFDGLFKELQIYKTSLTDAELITLTTI